MWHNYNQFICVTDKIAWIKGIYRLLLRSILNILPVARDMNTAIVPSMDGNWDVREVPNAELSAAEYGFHMHIKRSGPQPSRNDSYGCYTTKLCENRSTEKESKIFFFDSVADDISAVVIRSTMVVHFNELCNIVFELNPCISNL